MIYCFVDGAYSQKDLRGGVGVVIFRDSTLVSLYSRGFGYKGVTIGRMELSAAIIGLHSIQDMQDNITLWSDSQYVIMCLKNKTFERTENKDLWKLLDTEINRLGESRITYRHIHGHLNEESFESIGNGLADTLAVLGRSVNN